jgi:PAS domain S-box-containing protein
VKSTNPEFSERRREVDRLACNWTALLDNMLEMVVLIGEDFIIEYMNPNAVSSFGDLRGKKCREHLCNAGDRCEKNCPVRQTLGGERPAEAQETKIGETYVEYTSVLFRGYRGDTLVMLVMRDISERIRHEMQMAEFHENLGVVLRDKISELHETEKIQEKLYKEINVLKKKLHKRNFTDDMIGSSRRMRDLREMVYQVAESDATILITGESGTGKELVANLINKCSLRNDKPFLKVNCNTLTTIYSKATCSGMKRGPLQVPTPAR